VQVLRLCQKSGLVQMAPMALDGTKVEANASIHKAMSHEHMEKSEQQLRQEMRELLRKAELIDAQEDGRYGKGKRGSELPEELQRRESRLEKIRQAKAELEAEAAAAQARRRQKQADAAAKEAEQGDDDSKAKLSSRAHQKQQRADTARALHCRSSRRRESILKRWVCPARRTHQLNRTSSSCDLHRIPRSLSCQFSDQGS
jgi:hypothetical protein